MNMANWRLIIEGKNITHINWRGKATHYNFENIKNKGVFKFDNKKFYEGNRKVIVIDSNIENLSSLCLGRMHTKFQEFKMPKMARLKVL